MPLSYCTYCNMFGFQRKAELSWRIKQKQVNDRNDWLRLNIISLWMKLKEKIGPFLKKGAKSVRQTKMKSGVN